MDDRPLYRRVMRLEAGGARRRCARVCASGGDGRTEEEIWHIWRGTQPAGGAQRGELRQHQCADSRREAWGPAREGRTRLTHCTSSNSFTAEEVWVGAALCQLWCETIQSSIKQQPAISSVLTRNYLSNAIKLWLNEIIFRTNKCVWNYRNVIRKLKGFRSQSPDNLSQ